MSDLRPVDVLVVLGKNWQHRPFRLSLSSRMNALAAAEAYRRGYAGGLLLSGGRTAGSERPSEAEAMRKYILRVARCVPASGMALEERSIDTAGNAAETARLLGREWNGRVGLVTIRNHVPAACRLFAAHGLRVDSAWAAEDLLRQRSTRYAPFLRSRTWAPSSQFDALLEQVRRLVLLVDPKGDRLRFLTSRIRG